MPVQPLAVEVDRTETGSKASPPNQASRLLEIMRIRNEIAAGAYDNPQRMNAALQQMLEELWP